MCSSRANSGAQGSLVTTCHHSVISIPAILVWPPLRFHHIKPWSLELTHAHQLWKLYFSSRLCLLGGVVCSNASSQGRLINVWSPLSLWFMEPRGLPSVSSCHHYHQSRTSMITCWIFSPQTVSNVLHLDITSTFGGYWMTLSILVSAHKMATVEVEGQDHSQLPHMVSCQQSTQSIFWRCSRANPHQQGSEVWPLQSYFWSSD